MSEHTESLPRPIAVMGPTASGKSALGVEIARRLSGEIINVDSMQLYRGMDIGTAKLPPSERAGIKHHLLDIWDVRETASVATYASRARETVESLRSHSTVPVLVGGSMMYMQAVVDEWQFPPTDPQVRARYLSLQEDIGTVALHARLAEVDPAAAAIIEPNDPRRIARALEVIELTGKPFAASQPSKNQPPRWNTLMVGIETDMEWLGPRIEQRTLQMFARGFVDEVQALRTRGLVAASTAGRAIGYAQVLKLLDGDLTEEEAIEQTVRATRRYVRRQRSWFRRDPRIVWVRGRDDVSNQANQVLASYAGAPTRDC